MAFQSAGHEVEAEELVPKKNDELPVAPSIVTPTSTETIDGTISHPESFLASTTQRFPSESSHFNNYSSTSSKFGNDGQIFGVTSEDLVKPQNDYNNRNKNTLNISMSNIDPRPNTSVPLSPSRSSSPLSRPTSQKNISRPHSPSEHLFHPRPSLPSAPLTDVGITRPFTASPLFAPHDSARHKAPTPTHDTPRRFGSMSSRDAKSSAKERARSSDLRLADLYATTSDPGLSTPKSSPLRPHYRSDTPEPFPTHDLDTWYKQAPKETHSAEVDVDPVSGRKIINEYEIVGELGRGVHGKVKLGRNLQTDTHVAIKIIERVSKRRRLGRTGNQEAKIKREIAILKKARHKNIVGLLEVIDDPAMKKVYIVLEHVELGEIRWRTHGEDEICLVEYRRSQREADGVTEDSAAEYEDHHILETARRQLERRETEEREELRRVVGPWSMEHGGNSDTEIGHHPATEQQDELTPQILPTIETSLGDDQGQIDPPSLNPLQHNTKRYSDDLKTTDYHTAVEAHTPLDGTMYGPYDSYAKDDPEHSLLDSFSSPTNDYDMDRIPEHFRYVPVMTINEARKAIRDTVLGLEYLHYQGVIHRDIKPANLLMTRNHDIKISDFGVSYLGKAVKDQTNDDQSESDAQDYDEAIELAKTVGTPAFYAPELCRTDVDEENPPPVTNQIDVWAVGVTLYCFIFGRVPFHDQNTFVLMRNIAEQVVYIPRQRLKAVEDGEDVLEMAPTSPSIRATSPTHHGCYKRYSHDLEYEEVTEELRDLLKRLLTKDPRERIKLTEVKHHPWLLDDIKNPSRWIDENDPSKFTHGKKIEVSKEDVESAVRQNNVVDNIRNFTKKVIGGVMGLGKSHSRTRAKSTATVLDPQIPSTASSSSNMSLDYRPQEQRHGSLRPDELIYSAIKASRDQDHPLSHSVTASPEIREGKQFFDLPDNDVPHLGLPSRPVDLERGMSASGSIRTIRPKDLESAAMGSGSFSTSALPSTPQPIEHPATPLGGIFGGVKGTSKGPAPGPQSRQNRSRSISQKGLVSEDPHGEPSLAVSNASASGLVNLPSMLQSLISTSTSTGPSPSSSRAPSALGHHDPRSRETTEAALSRASSLSSVASRGRSDTMLSHPTAATLPLVHETSQEISNYEPLANVNEGTEEEVNRAKERQFRRLIQEDAQHKSDMFAEQQDRSEPQDECPPSPDDFIFPRHKSDASNFEHPPLTTPHNYYQRPAHAQTVAAGSSEGHFSSEMSQSTSNRSLPSAYSATSSYGYGLDHNVSQESTAKYHSTEFQHGGYHFPSATDMSYEEAQLETVDDGDDSDDSFIEMSRPKRPVSTQPSRSTSMSSKITQDVTQQDVVP